MERPKSVALREESSALDRNRKLSGRGGRRRRFRRCSGRGGSGCAGGKGARWQGRGRGRGLGGLRRGSEPSSHKPHADRRHGLSGSHAEGRRPSAPPPAAPPQPLTRLDVAVHDALCVALRDEAQDGPHQAGDVGLAVGARLDALKQRAAAREWGGRGQGCPLDAAVSQGTARSSRAPLAGAACVGVCGAGGARCFRLGGSRMEFVAAAPARGSQYSGTRLHRIGGPAGFRANKLPRRARKEGGGTLTPRTAP